MSDEITAARPDRQPVRVYVALAVLALSIVAGVVPPVVLSIWEAFTPTVTVLRGNAGTFHSATVGPGGFFAPTVTTVQTSESSVAVVGIFTQIRGRDLVIERSNKDGLRLCAVSDARACAALAGDWAGALSATSGATRVFDFQAHNLDYGHLGVWFVIGVLGFLLSGLAALIMSDFHDDNADTDDATESTKGGNA